MDDGAPEQDVVGSSGVITITGLDAEPVEAALDASEPPTTISPDERGLGTSVPGVWRVDAGPRQPGVSRAVLRLLPVPDVQWDGERDPGRSDAVNIIIWDSLPPHLDQ